MKYCISTVKRGWVIRPDCKWNGDKNFLFRIKGNSDSSYLSDPDTRRSVNGWMTRLCGAVISVRSKMMPIVALSVTEAELFAATLAAQDMLFIMRILHSVGLKVELPMILEVDNKSVKDIANNWTTGGRTRHIEVKQYFLRELKEAGLIHVKWISGDSNPSDIFTKNLGGPLFNKHVKSFVGYDEYLQDQGSVTWDEEVVIPHQVNHEGRVSDGLTGLSGGRNPLAVENVKYQLAQDIIDDEVSSMQDSMEPVEVTGALFGGIRGAAGFEDYDWEYLKVWSQIVVL